MPRRVTEAGRMLSSKNKSTITEVVKGVATALRPLGDLAGIEASVLSEAWGAVAAAAPDAEDTGEETSVEEGAHAVTFEAETENHFAQRVWNAYEYGKLTRDEADILFAAMRSAMKTFRTELTKNAPQLDTRFWWSTPSEEMDAEESATNATFPVSLREAEGSGGRSFEACIITPGWGSSGYYSADVLKRDGPKVFTAGLHSFYDHPTASDEIERPERSVRDLAAVLIESAVWKDNGWNGPGLYAMAEALPGEAEQVQALAPQVGLSIRADAIARIGEAEGRRGYIVERLVAADSVDIVTKAGRGGKIRLRESASKEQQGMPNISTTEEQSGGLSESLRAELRALRESVEQQQQQNAQLRSEITLREGQNYVTAQISGDERLPTLARSRLMREVTPVIVDGAFDQAATDRRIEEAVENELAYINQVAAARGAGRPRDLGNERSKNDPEKIAADAQAAFRSLGLSEAAAARAAGKSA